MSMSDWLDNIVWLLPSAPLAVGAIVIALALWVRAVRRGRLFRTGVRSHGVVVGHETSGSGGSRVCTFRSPELGEALGSHQNGRTTPGGRQLTRYRPLVEFHAERGGRAVGRPSAWKTHPALAPGRSILIFYDRDDPSKIAIRGYPFGRETRLVVLVAGVLIVVFMALLSALAPSASSIALQSFIGLVTPFLVLAVIAIAVGAVSIFGTIRTKTGPRYQGVVVGDYACQSPQGLTQHHAVVRWFSPKTGMEIEAATGRGRLDQPRKIGELVTVYQHPTDLSRILISGDGPNPWAVGFLLVGGLLTVVQLTLLVSSWNFVFGG